MQLSGTWLAPESATQKVCAANGYLHMSLVRLLGFRTLACGCVIGCYRELATERELRYVEEKGVHCDLQSHRRNHTILADRPEAKSATQTKAPSLRAS